MTAQLWSVEIARPDGSTFTEGVHADDATTAVTLMRSTYPNAPVRLWASPGARVRAAYVVARDLARGPFDEWLDQGFIPVWEAVEHTRNTLTLPEAPHVPGGYPLEDYGNWESAAFRIILEASPADLEELRLALGDGSVRL